MHTHTQHPPATAGQSDRQPVAAILQPPLQTLPPLAEYVDLPGLLPAVQSSFPTLESIRWFVRVHRDALSRSGAVIALAGRLRYHPALFAQIAVEIGRNAAKPVEGGA